MKKEVPTNLNNTVKKLRYLANTGRKFKILPVIFYKEVLIMEENENVDPDVLGFENEVEGVEE